DAWQILLATPEIADQSQHHPDPGGRESVVPSIVRALREISADDRAEECAGVDADVEDREARVATRIAFLVDLPDHRRHVRLEEPGPDDDETQPGVEGVH